MAGSPTGTERRKDGRRDEDKMPLARLTALEKGRAQDRKEAAKDRRVMNEHLKECAEARQETNTKVDSLLVKTDEQSAVLADLQEVLPWLKSQYSSSKWWRDLGHSASAFFLNMIRKNWDSLSGKLIFFAVGAILLWRGASWADVLKLFGG